jgi:hypothetical protein
MGLRFSPALSALFFLNTLILTSFTSAKYHPMHFLEKKAVQAPALYRMTTVQMLLIQCRCIWANKIDWMQQAQQLAEVLFNT